MFEEFITNFTRGFAWFVMALALVVMIVCTVILYWSAKWQHLATKIDKHYYRIYIGILPMLIFYIIGFVIAYVNLGTDIQLGGWRWVISIGTIMILALYYYLIHVYIMDVEIFQVLIAMIIILLTLLLSIGCINKGYDIYQSTLPNESIQNLGE